MGGRPGGGLWWQEEAGYGTMVWEGMVPLIWDQVLKPRRELYKKLVVKNKNSKGTSRG